MCLWHHAAMEKTNMMLKPIRKFISSSDREALHKARMGCQSGFPCTIRTSIVKNDKPKLDKLQRKGTEDNNENGNPLQQGRLKRLGSVAWAKTRGRKQIKNVNIRLKAIKTKGYCCKNNKNTYDRLQADLGKKQEWNLKSCKKMELYNSG